MRKYTKCTCRSAPENIASFVLKNYNILKNIADFICYLSPDIKLLGINRLAEEK